MLRVTLPDWYRLLLLVHLSDMPSRHKEQERTGHADVLQSASHLNPIAVARRSWLGSSSSAACWRLEMGAYKQSFLRSWLL